MGEDTFFEALGGQVFEPSMKQYVALSEMFRKGLSGEDLTCQVCWSRVASSDRTRHHTWHHEEEQRIATMAIEIVKMLSEIPNLGEPR